jgi:hypothetical protein
MQKNVKNNRLRTLGNYVFVIMLSCGITWFVMRPYSFLNEARAKHFSLVRVLEIYHSQHKHYPKKIAELTRSVPDFDPAPFAHYDEHEECILTTSYCAGPGDKYEIHYAVGAGIVCSYISNSSSDFDCHD